MSRNDSTIQMPTRKTTGEAELDRPKDTTAAVVVRAQLVVVSRRERQVSERLSSPRKSWAMAASETGGGSYSFLSRSWVSFATMPSRRCDRTVWLARCAHRAHRVVEE